MQAEKRFTFVLKQKCSGDASLCADSSFPVKIKEPLDVCDLFTSCALATAFPPCCVPVFYKCVFEYLPKIYLV